jgi:hypothetical protein
LSLSKELKKYAVAGPARNLFSPLYLYGTILRTVLFGFLYPHWGYRNKPLNSCHPMVHLTSIEKGKNRVSFAATSNTM